MLTLEIKIDPEIQGDEPLEVAIDEKYVKIEKVTLTHKQFEDIRIYHDRMISAWKEIYE